MVTCDCGTGAVAPISRLCSSGVDVVVTDHHLPSGELPDCLAILNPKRPGCGYPDKDLAAVAVTWKLCLALVRALGANENPIWAMLDLVALAMVGVWIVVGIIWMIANSSSSKQPIMARQP